MTLGAVRATLGALLLTLASHASAHEPLASRDQNPLIRGLYLPVPSDDAPADGSLIQRFVLTLSNTTTLETEGGESLHVDGESLELRWLLAWRPVERVRLRFTVPVVHYGGGTLDHAVDEWHDLLGLSDGARAQVPSDDFTYRYAMATGAVQMTDSGAALGDSALEAGWLLTESTRRRLSLWVGMEAPTGDEARLTGNDAWDAAAWLEGDMTTSKRMRLAGRLGVVRPGSAAPLPLAPRDWVAFGSLGAAWDLGPSLALAMQLDAHDGMLADTQLRFLGPALQLTVAAQYRSANGWSLHFGIAEDLYVGASPDVTFQLGVRIGGHDPR